MPLPNMAKVLNRFAQSLSLIRVEQQIVDFRPVDTETEFEVQAVVQPAQKEKINPAIINWSLKYFLVHSKQEILLGDRMEYCGIKFKAVEVGLFGDYGFHEAIFEEMK